MSHAALAISLVALVLAVIAIVPKCPCEIFGMLAQTREELAAQRNLISLLQQSFNELKADRGQEPSGAGTRSEVSSGNQSSDPKEKGSK